LRAVAKGTRSELEQLEGIASEGRQLLKLFGSYRALEIGGFRVNQGNGITADGHGFRCGTDLQLQVYAVGLLGDNANAFRYFCFETCFFDSDCEFARRKTIKVIDAVFVGFRLKDLSGFFVRQRYSGPGNHAPLRIGHRALDGSAILRRCPRREDVKAAQHSQPVG
jgi:hypothetical protein